MAQNHTKRDPSEYSVMVVDDDRFLLDMYALKLREAGLSVDTCESGDAAIEKLRDGATPDAIMLDIVMPGMDGFAFMEALKQEQLPKPPVLIVLSNQGQDSDVEQAEQLGADAYIVKASAVPSEVVTKCLNILEKHDKG